jgi:hypothetical protein
MTGHWSLTKWSRICGDQNFGHRWSLVMTVTKVCRMVIFYYSLSSMNKRTCKFGGQQTTCKNNVGKKKHIWEIVAGPQHSIMKV